ncbi:MAG TPA: hypothetical protein VE549_02005 [Myxococcaceae bacterium]|jgi:hypothetical protein|nr:hypothetical protein [Myxococcaceae bacterium]
MRGGVANRTPDGGSSNGQVAVAVAVNLNVNVERSRQHQGLMKPSIKAEAGCR